MITVVIPAFNEEAIIHDTLARVKRGLAHVPHEIIVSDDGSTDATAQRAGEHAHHIVRYEGQIPKTIGAARNRGAQKAGNDIIVFLDSDVRLHEPTHFFDTVLQHFADNPKLVAMTAYARVYPSHETWSDRLVLGFLNIQYRVMNKLGLGVTHGKCMIVRASTFRDVGGFKEHIIASEDMELFQRLAKKGETLVDSSLTFYFSGRRAHAVGWPRLLTVWTLNAVWVMALGRSWSKQWTRADREL